MTWNHLVNDYQMPKFTDHRIIPGNDQNFIPTNQGTAKSKVERTSYLMFYGFRRHLKSFLGVFLVYVCLSGYVLKYLVKNFGIQRSNI